MPANGLDLAVWEWQGGSPTLVFAHATGFHGRCWDQIARHFPAHRRLALDFRGHGRSSKPDPPYPWRPFADDLLAIAEALEVRGAVGIGHSMGGHTVTAAAIDRPSVFASLVLIDATIFPEARYGGPRFDAEFIRRRRAVFRSPAEMWERFHNRMPFVRWDPAVLRDYCEFALLPSDGKFVLACPPEVEASIYEHSLAPASSLYPGLRWLAQPALVMRAGTTARPGMFDLNSSPTAPGLAALLPRGQDLLLPEHNHFIPMEAPGLVVEWIGRYLESARTRVSV